MVGKDIPPFITAGRSPTRYEGLNVIGLRRRGFSDETIGAIHDIYRYLYQKGMNVTQAVEAIRNELPDSPERSQILTFVETSKRGIVR